MTSQSARNHHRRPPLQRSPAKIDRRLDPANSDSDDDDDLFFDPKNQLKSSFGTDILGSVGASTFGAEILGSIQGSSWGEIGNSVFDGTDSPLVVGNRTGVEHQQYGINNNHRYGCSNMSSPSTSPPSTKLPSLLNFNINFDNNFTSSNSSSSTPANKEHSSTMLVTRVQNFQGQLPTPTATAPTLPANNNNNSSGNSNNRSPVAQTAIAADNNNSDGDQATNLTNSTGHQMPTNIISNSRPGCLKQQQQQQQQRQLQRNTPALCSSSSLVDGLLSEIYDRWHYPPRDSFDSDTFTECSSTSDAFFGRSDSLQLTEFEQKHGSRFNRTSLEAKDIPALHNLIAQLRYRVNQCSAVLIRQLKRLDRRRAKSHRNYDLVTAILQAASLKRRIDARIRFSVEPLPGDDAFQQWRDAMKAVARLPLGIPQEFRKKVWLSLADQHISNIKLDWQKTTKLAFNERSNPDDNKLGAQIVKDLHRTGCSGFNGHDNEEDRAVLKRVLLAYARWNKMVGYCQGFNVIAALILDVMERKEDDALKVMILLIDHVLPDSYFANNLRALSVDMAVFRDLLAIHLPQLSKHLDHLQSAAADDSTGANYEPPLTNVFTMQWFLTLFATCLPKSTALRVWDSVLLEGSEMLFRTALAIWGKLQDRILVVQSADEFYMTMGSLCQEMLDENTTTMDADSVIKMVYAMGPFPLPNLAELREKYTYNITPFTAAMNAGAAGRRPLNSASGSTRGSRASGLNIFSDDDDWDDDDIADQINCFAGIFPGAAQMGPAAGAAGGLGVKAKAGELDKAQSYSAFDMSKVSPGAFGSTPQLDSGVAGSGYQERMTMDINMLKNQYKRLRHRQKQAHVICAAASAARRDQKPEPKAPIPSWMPKSKHLAPVFAPTPPPMESPVAVNHLFIGRNKGGVKSSGKNIQASNISPLFPQMQRGGATMKSVQVQKARSKSKSSEVLAEEPGTASPEKSICSNDSSTETMTPSPRRPKQTSRRQSANSTDSCASEASNNTRDSPVSCNVESDSEGPEDSTVVVPSNRAEALDSTRVATLESTDSSHSPMKVVGTAGQDLMVSDRNSSEITKDLENTNQYLTQMMYNRQKKTLTSQEKNNNVQSLSPGDDATPGSTNRKATSPTGHKSHNPFVIRMNPKRAETGVKLGLYSADNLPVVDMKVRATREGVKEIGRAQINACLHRQYMQEVKQQARTYKNQ